MREDWALAYARQADADFRAWELCQQHPEAVAAECHPLLFLQMTCEKLCKARLILWGSSLYDLQSSHGYTAKNLPTIMKQEIGFLPWNRKKGTGLQQLIRHLANEIEVLSPSAKRDDRRPDNCEYPWEIGGKVISPLDYSFKPTRLCFERGGPTFVKLLRTAIDRIIGELT